MPRIEDVVGLDAVPEGIYRVACSALRERGFSFIEDLTFKNPRHRALWTLGPGEPPADLRHAMVHYDVDRMHLYQRLSIVLRQTLPDPDDIGDAVPIRAVTFCQLTHYAFACDGVGHGADWVGTEPAEFGRWLDGALGPLSAGDLYPIQNQVLYMSGRSLPYFLVALSESAPRLPFVGALTRFVRTNVTGGN